MGHGVKLSFRRATSEDADAFLALEHSVIGTKTYSGSANRAEALQEIAENEVYLIYRDEQLIGSTAFQMKSHDHAYLSGMVVHPDFQGQSIAREAALFRLRKLQGVKRIDLVTHPGNFKVIRLWKTLGFQIEKRIENYFGDGEPRLVLVKERQL
ncbi:MAG: Acetyltransferase [Parcubacteria group bacterium Gr01-1014_91]|nr:MAG: Acetyltransferase [Parcubacteria group bacterium Gr01-1014_91]